MGNVAIIEPVITQLVEETRALVAAMNEADVLADAYERKLGEQREIQKARRIELGMMLRKAREVLPARSNEGRGWMNFLEAVEMSDTTAYRYMQEAGWTSGRSLIPNVQNKDAGAGGPDVPPPSDDDAPAPDDEPEIDRDAWCTPKDVAVAIGSVYRDPCSNAHSHILAAKTFRLDLGQDGLELAATVDPTELEFINPPYSRGQVARWIAAYKHTRFIFLLRFDPSTAWFRELIEATALVLFLCERIEFEPPPGAPEPTSNPFPHALFYARGSDATKAIRALCFSPWRTK